MIARLKTWLQRALRPRKPQTPRWDLRTKGIPSVRDLFPNLPSEDDLLRRRVSQIRARKPSQPRMDDLRTNRRPLSEWPFMDNEGNVWNLPSEDQKLRARVRELREKASAR